MVLLVLWSGGLVVLVLLLWQVSTQKQLGPQYHRTISPGPSKASGAGVPPKKRLVLVPPLSTPLSTPLYKQTPPRRNRQKPNTPVKHLTRIESDDPFMPNINVP